MYDLLRGLHNLLRWVVLGGGIYALVMAYRGLFAGAMWSNQNRVSGLVFTSALNTQLLVGLVLYVVSPLTRAALQNMGAAMQNENLRFFAVEHSVTMILAVVVAQLGFSMAKRAARDAVKYRWSAAAYTVALLLVLSMIPWWRPFLPWG